MAYTKLCVLVLLASTAFSQGSVLDEAMGYIQEMADLVTASVDGVDTSTTQLRLRVQSHFDELKSKIASETNEKVEDAIAKSADKKCQPDHAHHLKTISESISDRFLECINMTDSVAQLEYFIYNVVHDVEGVEDVVCDGIQNVTKCTSLNFIEKLPCVTQAIMDFGSSFKKETGHVREIITKVEDFGKEIADHFLRCFTKWSLTADAEVNAAVQSNCKS